MHPSNRYLGDLVTRLGHTLSDTRIMDPWRPDAGRGRGSARPLSVLAGSAGAVCTLDGYARARGRPEGLALAPAPKRDAPRAEVVGPRATTTLDAYAASVSMPATRSLDISEAPRARALPSAPAFRRHSSPFDANPRRHSSPIDAGPRRHSSPIDAVRRLSQSVPPSAPRPPTVRAYAAPLAPSITYRVPQPRPMPPAAPSTADASDGVTPPLQPLSASGATAVSAQLHAAARAVAAATPVITRAALEERADAGKVTSREEVLKAQRLEQMTKLVAVMPLPAIAHHAHVPVEALATVDSRRLAQHMLARGKPSMWTPGTIADLKNVWVRFMVWLERRGIQHDGMSFDAVTLGEFLDHVSAEAKAKAAGRKERAAALDASAKARAAAKGEPPPPPKKYNDGACAEQGVVDKLSMMSRHFGVHLPFAQARSSRQNVCRAPMPTPALTIGIVFRLYAFVASVATSWKDGRLSVSQPAPERRGELFHAAVAAYMLFASFSCNRMEQVNNCFFAGEVAGYLHGVLRLDKNPKPEKRQARPFWMRIAGFDGGTVWFQFLKAVLAGVEVGCFVCRDFDGTSGDPRDATRFLNNALDGPRLVHAMACVISRVCGVAFDTAKRWAKHSARHFLMECSSARKVHALRGVEIGRWSGSTAQNPDLTPNQRLNQRHVLEAGKMPEAYAPCTKVDRVTAILGDEMEALSKLWGKANAQTSGGIDAIPVFGDFSPLQEWMADPHFV